MNNDIYFIKVAKSRHNFVDEFTASSITDAVDKVVEKFKTYDSPVQVHIYHLKDAVMFEQGIGEYATLLQVRIFNPAKKFSKKK